MTDNRNDVCITLWDSNSDPSNQTGLVYLWNGYAERGSVRSLFRYVEDNGKRLRCKYLAWIHDLGEYRIGGKRIVDHLALEDGLSYWWMTPLVEKSPWKTPSIIDAIRLLALEEILLGTRPAQFRLVSSNRDLCVTLGDLCRNLGIAFEWDRLRQRPLRPPHLRDVYQTLPHAMQGLVRLARYLRTQWPLRKAGLPRWSSSDRALFFCSYFFFDGPPKLAEDSQFRSRYWEGLHNLMGRLGLSANWIEIYQPHNALPNSRAAMDRMRHFNQQRQGQGLHAFITAYLSPRIVLRVLQLWLKLFHISLKLGEIEMAFRPRGSTISFWPLMRRDWQSAMRGAVAIDNLLWIELFNRALIDLPYQRKGLYLCENQAWERALIHAWRNHGHGQLIAVAHSTVRFWDLRYFTDQRTRQSSDTHPMPQADLTAINGKAAMDAYLGAGYPSNVIVECEALRYGYLNYLRGRHPLKNEGKVAIKVLVLCDFMPSGTMRMLQLLEAAAPDISAPIAYTVKPHPNFMFDGRKFPALHLQVVTDPLETIIQNFDVAYSSNLTSAAVDAYLGGLPVVVMLEETELNFSPLRGRSGVRFVSTSEELAEALEGEAHGARTVPDRNAFFFLDPEMPRWEKLLQV